ncbi:MAG: HDOD domain-containing protein [Desulfomonilia bacterium]
MRDSPIKIPRAFSEGFYVEENLFSERDRTREQILDVLGKTRDILTLPNVVHEILEVTSGKNSSAADLTNIIEGDPALTGKILAVANSAYYGFVKKISSISHAVVILGFREIQNIALSMSVLQLFDRKGTEFNEQLWRHSFAVGVGTRMVAGHLGLKLDGKYFVAGLLHDAGKIFLSQFLPEMFDRVLTTLEMEENKYTYHSLEDRIFGISHADIGGRLLNSWMFPSEIIHAVTYHHQPSSTETEPVFAACVHIADLLCSIKGITPLNDHFFLTLDADILPVVSEYKENFGTEDMHKLLAQLDIEIERQSSFVAAFKRK